MHIIIIICHFLFSQVLEMGMDWSVRQGYAWAAVSYMRYDRLSTEFSRSSFELFCHPFLYPNYAPWEHLRFSQDKEHCEEYGRMLQADASKVSKRAKKRGLPQLGTLGAGNHYCEIQVKSHANIGYHHISLSSASNRMSSLGAVCA